LSFILLLLLLLHPAVVVVLEYAVASTTAKLKT